MSSSLEEYRRGERIRIAHEALSAHIPVCAARFLPHYECVECTRLKRQLDEAERSGK
jgi:hypothetical protein